MQQMLCGCGGMCIDTLLKITSI